jgi:hypothetical protein
MTFSRTRIAALMGMLFLGACLNSVAQSVTLNFDTLPSSQCLPDGRCWTYEAFNGYPSSENQAFQLEGGHLLMDTVSMKLFQLGGGDNVYHLFNVAGNPVVDPAHSFSITVVAKVNDYENYNYQTGQGAKTNGDQNANPCGFGFGAYTGPTGDEWYWVCMSDVRLVLVGNAGIPFDTTVVHEYRLEVLPGVGAKLFVDGEQKLTTSPMARQSSDHNPAGLWLGDMTGGANATVEIHRFVYASHAQD